MLKGRKRFMHRLRSFACDLIAFCRTFSQQSNWASIRLPAPFTICRHSWSQALYRYTKLAVYFLAVAVITASTYLAYQRSIVRLSRLAGLVKYIMVYPCMVSGVIYLNTNPARCMVTSLMRSRLTHHFLVTIVILYITMLGHRTYGLSDVHVL